MPRFLASFWDPPGRKLTLEPSNDVDGKSAQWSDDDRFSLSAPIIRVSLAELSDPDRLEQLRKTFQYWVRLENYNCDLRRVGILRFRMPAKYRTNEIPTHSGFIEQGKWKVTPEQLTRALHTLVEVVDCVGHQLHGAGDRESALHAALLLRHILSVRQPELANDPRWSLGVSPSLVTEVARELNDPICSEGYAFEGLDKLATIVLELTPVKKYLSATAKE